MNTRKSLANCASRDGMSAKTRRLYVCNMNNFLLITFFYLVYTKRSRCTTHIFYTVRFKSIFFTKSLIIIQNSSFTVSVKIKSLCIIGGEGEAHPSKMKLFKNREDIDFSNADDVKAEQEFELVEDVNGTIDYSVKQVKFNNVTSLTMYVVCFF